MMEKCENCGYYMKDVDEMFILHDDTKPEGKETEVRHICHRFNNPISEDVFGGKQKCPEYWDKPDFSEEEELLSRMSEEDKDAIFNSTSDEEVLKIITKYS